MCAQYFLCKTSAIWCNPLPCSTSDDSPGPTIHHFHPRVLVKEATLPALGVIRVWPPSQHPAWVIWSLGGHELHLTVHWVLAGQYRQQRTLVLSPHKSQLVSQWFALIQYLMCCPDGSKQCLVVFLTLCTNSCIFFIILRAF